MCAKMLGDEMDSPPYELHADSTVGRLVGIWAPESSGVMCHAGARSHLHVVLDEGDGLTGHVDSVGLVAGAVLKLPAS